jgi:hypothetical protein
VGRGGPKKTRQELIAERQAARNAALAKAGRGRAKMGGGDEDIDPMDPVCVREHMGYTLTLVPSQGFVWTLGPEPCALWHEYCVAYLVPGPATYVSNASYTLLPAV